MVYPEDEHKLVELYNHVKGNPDKFHTARKHRYDGTEYLDVMIRMEDVNKDEVVEELLDKFSVKLKENQRYEPEIVQFVHIDD